MYIEKIIFVNEIARTPGFNTKLINTFKKTRIYFVTFLSKYVPLPVFYTFLLTNTAIFLLLFNRVTKCYILYIFHIFQS